MMGRVSFDDETVPVDKDGFQYYSRLDDGCDYYKHYQITPGGTKNLLLDENIMAQGKTYFSAGLGIAPNHEILAVMVDDTGDEKYNLSLSGSTKHCK